MSTSETNLGPLPELIELLLESGEGVTIMPVRKGMPRGGFCSDEVYAADGWDVGYISPTGGGDLASGDTIANAVTAALVSAAQDVFRQDEQ